MEQELENAVEVALVFFKQVAVVYIGPQVFNPLFQNLLLNHVTANILGCIIPCHVELSRALQNF